VLRGLVPLCLFCYSCRATVFTAHPTEARRRRGPDLPAPHLPALQRPRGTPLRARNRLPKCRIPFSIQGHSSACRLCCLPLLLLGEQHAAGIQETAVALGSVGTVRHSHSLCCVLVFPPGHAAERAPEVGAGGQDPGRGTLVGRGAALVQKGVGDEQGE